MRSPTYGIGVAAAAAASIAFAGIAVQADGGGQACEYSIASPLPLVPATGGSGVLSIATGAGCAWSASAFTRDTDLHTPALTVAAKTFYERDVASVQIAAGAAGGKASKDFKIAVTVSDGYGSATASATWTVKKR